MPYLGNFSKKNTDIYWTAKVNFLSKQNIVYRRRYVEKWIKIHSMYATRHLDLAIFKIFTLIIFISLKANSKYCAPPHECLPQVKIPFISNYHYKILHNGLMSDDM